MAQYKTPGVYIEEITKFPPSVAQVETAIPVFVGYTEKATRDSEGDLLQKATRIVSMMEYENLFGLANPETNLKITFTEEIVNGDIVTNLSAGFPKDEVTQMNKDERSPFLMYYALQMFFANGGGPCYILSMNTYDKALADNAAAPISFDDYIAGIALLEFEDEPTLLVFPDAPFLSEAGFHEVNKAALMHCNKMQDRFTIIDTYNYDDDTTVFTDNIRNGIDLEKDFIKYGAVYYPYLQTIVNYRFNDADVNITHNSNAGVMQLSALETIEYSIDSLTKKVSEFDSTNTRVQALSAGDAVTENEALFATASRANKLLVDANKKANALKNALDNLATPETNAALDGVLLGGGAETIETLIASMQSELDDFNPNNSTAPTGSEIKTAFGNITGLLNNATGTLNSLFDAIEAIDIGEPDELVFGEYNNKTLGETKSINSLLYNLSIVAIEDMPVILPPSSTMAGVYARVDETRGVWKAPANVGVNYVIKPTVKITNDQQDGLNVDVLSGKSINAIRSFVGKGNLVWGARTLAGNDKEWRYVSVRRFFNMAEESIKKASHQFVFEPNDANTWVKVKAMISNFLNLQWKAGALAGPTPEKAFYVNIGLGETMTAEDILDGYMIIEIGMAVVRPAEFIVLKFSHKMQEA